MHAANGQNVEGPVLQAYLLGTVDFEAALALQRRLVYEVAGDRTRAALVLCEHLPLITVGRQGSWGHILADPAHLRARSWQVRWVNRGGGCLLHLPGQLAIYSIMPLDRFGLGLAAYLHALQRVVLAVLQDFGVRGEDRPGHAGVWVGSRLIAPAGVAVRDWVTYYGMVLNVNPVLEPFRLVRNGNGLVTSLERERRAPLRPGMVRQRVVEHFAEQFRFGRISIFSDHPSLKRQAPSDALATSS